MNAILLLSTAWMAGADPIAAPAPTAAPVVVTSSAGCGGCAAPSCGSPCSSCSKPSFWDKIKARFAKPASCGCEKPKCEKAPKCAKAASCIPCGTPLFSGHICSKPAPCSTCAPAPTCSTCNSCSKPSLLDKIKAHIASWKSKSCCSTPAPACGGCAAAPTGCAPAAIPTAPPVEAPKTMPKPDAPKKSSTGIIVPSNLTPASSSELAVPVVPSAKSPY